VIAVEGRRKCNNAYHKQIVNSVGVTAEVYKNITSVSNNVIHVVTQSFFCIYHFDFNSVITHGTRAPSGRGLHHCRGLTITLRHTTLSAIPLDEWSALRRDLNLTTHNVHKRQIYMAKVGFEPAIPATEPPKTHVLDREATGTGED